MFRKRLIMMKLTSYLQCIICSPSLWRKRLNHILQAVIDEHKGTASAAGWDDGWAHGGKKEGRILGSSTGEDGLGAMVVIGGRASFTFSHISCLDIFGAWKIFWNNSWFSFCSVDDEYWIYLWWGNNIHNCTPCLGNIFLRRRSWKGFRRQEAGDDGYFK